MKKIFNKTVLFASLIFLIAGCDDDGFRPCIKGKGDVSTETRSPADFTDIDFSLEGSVEIRKSDRREVLVEGYSNQLEYVTMKVSDGKLKIYSDRCLKNTEFRCIVYTPEFSGLKLSGSCEGFINDSFGGAEINLELSGSGKLVAKTLNASKVRVRLSGSGTMDIGGECDLFRADLSGSGDIRAFPLIASDLEAHVSGSGSIEAFVTNRLEASISGSATIRYKGNPPVVQANVSGSGRVVKVQ